LEQTPYNSLSRTRNGELWLSQFAKEDRATASLLLDSIVKVSNMELIKGISNLIENILEQDETPVALFVARENRGSPYFTRRSRRPLSVSARQGVGSEGILVHLCRDLETKHSKLLLNHPSINEMKESKCRQLVVLDDMIGSGTRIENFTSYLMTNRTLKSWYSFKYFKIAVCAYYASEYGVNYLSNCKFINRVKVFRAQTRGRSFWNPGQNRAIYELCEKYAQYTSRPKLPYGYKNAFTNVIFSHKCPNTNPAILWATEKDSWSGVFGSRPELDLESWFTTKTDHQEKLLRMLGQTRLCESSIFSKLNTESQKLFVFLACVAMKKRNIFILSDMMELPISVIRMIAYKCENYTWIDKHFHLTEKGRKILESARRYNWLQALEIKVKKEFYYPKSFRSPAGSSSTGLQKGEHP
jgi:hypothetical protein